MEIACFPTNFGQKWGTLTIPAGGLANCTKTWERRKEYWLNHGPFLVRLLNEFLANKKEQLIRYHSRKGHPNMTFIRMSKNMKICTVYFFFQKHFSLPIISGPISCFQHTDSISFFVHVFIIPRLISGHHLGRSNYGGILVLKKQTGDGYSFFSHLRALLSFLAIFHA